MDAMHLMDNLELSREDGLLSGVTLRSEDDAVAMEALRKLSAAMLRQAAADIRAKADPQDLQSLREAAAQGDKDAMRHHDALQERLHYKRTARQWLEHWQDKTFDLPFVLCAEVTWPACEPAHLAKLILDRPDEYLSIAQEPRSHSVSNPSAEPSAAPRPPRH